MRVLVLLAFLLASCTTRSGDESYDWGGASKVIGDKTGRK